jgi:hypothetical protein
MTILITVLIACSPFYICACKLTFEFFGSPPNILTNLCDPRKKSAPIPALDNTYTQDYTVSINMYMRQLKCVSDVNSTWLSDMI